MRQTTYAPRGMAIHNHTPWSYDEVRQLPSLGSMINQWRERNVALFAHPTDQEMLISVGITFDTSMCLVAVEPRAIYRTALDYAARGQTYVAD